MVAVAICARGWTSQDRPDGTPGIAPTLVARQAEAHTYLQFERRFVCGVNPNAATRRAAS